MEADTPYNSKHLETEPLEAATLTQTDPSREALADRQSDNTDQ